jgi:hypothetical protein
VRDKKGSARP